MTELPNWICRNEACSSYGMSHPNCRCKPSFAEGGCVGPHEESCQHYADGGQVADNHEFINNPEQALDAVGAQHGLHHLLTKLGDNGRSPNPHKHLSDYRESVKRGKKTIDSHVSNIFDPKSSDFEPDHEGVENLKSTLASLQSNPEQALNVGGNLSQELPMHGAALGAKTAQAMNYLGAIKPNSSQAGPLDPVTPPSKINEARYNRQLSIAQNPVGMISHHIKNGTIQPQDLHTLHTVYPRLGEALVKKAAEGLIDHKSKGHGLTWKQKRGLSELLGQPLDFIQTPAASQAIMQANAPIQMPQPQGKKKKSGATAQTQKTIEKTDNLYSTPTQNRLMDKKE